MSAGRTSAFGAALVLAAAALSACGAGPSAVSSPRFPAPPLSAVSVDGAGLTATLAMGNLSQPENTFWQLVYRPDDASRWALLTPPGTATNGGVAVAPSATATLTTGVLASLGLTFSPLASTTDLGGNWTTAVLPGPLAVAPSVLALNGQLVLALLATHRGEVVESHGSFAASSWSTILDVDAVRGDPDCDVAALTSVALVEGTPVVGAACARRGTSSTPMLARIGGAWRPVGPSILGTNEVLRLTPVPGGLVAVIESRTAGAGDVEVVRLTDTLRVTAVGELTLGAATVASTTVGSSAVTDVVVQRPDGSCVAEAFDGSRTVALPALPAGACVVVGVPGHLEALRSEGSILAVYGVARTHHWVVVQRLVVPIQYGSTT